MPSSLTTLRPSFRARTLSSASTKHLRALYRGESEPSRRHRPLVDPSFVIIVHSFQALISNCSRVVVVALNKAWLNATNAPFFLLFNAQKITSNSTLAAKKRTIECLLRLGPGRSDPVTMQCGTDCLAHTSIYHSFSCYFVIAFFNALNCI